MPFALRVPLSSHRCRLQWQLSNLVALGSIFLGPISSSNPRANVHSPDLGIEGPRLGQWNHRLIGFGNTGWCSTIQNPTTPSHRANPIEAKHLCASWRRRRIVEDIRFHPSFPQFAAMFVHMSKWKMRPKRSNIPWSYRKKQISQLQISHCWVAPSPFEQRICMTFKTWSANFVRLKLGHKTSCRMIFWSGCFKWF